MIKHVLITGVSSGIGYDAVRHLVARGWHVFGSVRNQSDADRLRADFPKNFTCLQFDVTNREEIDRTVPVVMKVLGGCRLAGLVNNAGHAVGGPMELLPDDVFRQQIEVNLFGARNVTNSFLPLLGTDTTRTGPPGKIIMVSSVSGVINTPINGAYCVSKHALESLAEIYRRELKPFGIQISSIQPGPIASNLWQKNSGKLSQYEESGYRLMVQNAELAMAQAETNALPATAISQLIERILETRRPRLSYLVIRNFALTWLLVHAVPRRLADWLIHQKMNRPSAQL